MRTPRSAVSGGRPRSFFAPLAAVVLVLQATSVVQVDNYRILAVETVPGKSHWNFMSAVLRSLTDAGHRVTVFTPFPDGDRENYTEVDTSGDLPMTTIVDHDALGMMEMYGSPVAVINMLTAAYRQFTDFTLANARLQAAVDENRMTEDDGFDAIIVEPLDPGFAAHLSRALNAVPVVYAIPSPMFSTAEREYTGHLANPASVAHHLFWRAVPDTFALRLINAAIAAYEVLVFSWHEWTAKIFDPKPYDRVPTVHPSVVFHNSHYITETPRPVAANYVAVGGIHLQKPSNSVPKDILEFIEDSPHGVIYFSFGSSINMSTLPGHVESAFTRALSRVPQKVLWRREKPMADKPANVMVRKWFPQRELLLHPSVKLFISHGGISGLYEAADAGVPTLGFPLVFDQPRNIGHLVHNGMAISMDLLSVTEDALFDAIQELVENDKYKKNAMIASERFKDRPLSPAQLVVYWTEYVIRHKGAPHLRSQALNLTWYQYLLLDVIAAVLLLVSFTVFILYKLFKVIIRKCVLRFPVGNKIKVQ